MRGEGACGGSASRFINRSPSSAESTRRGFFFMSFSSIVAMGLPPLLKDREEPSISINAILYYIANCLHYEGASSRISVICPLRPGEGRRGRKAIDESRKRKQHRRRKFAQHHAQEEGTRAGIEFHAAVAQNHDLA